MTLWELIDDDEDDYVVTRDMLAEIEGGVLLRLDWVKTYGEALRAVRANEHVACGGRTIRKIELNLRVFGALRVAQQALRGVQREVGARAEPGEQGCVEVPAVCAFHPACQSGR